MPWSPRMSTLSMLSTFRYLSGILRLKQGVQVSILASKVLKQGVHMSTLKNPA